MRFALDVLAILTVVPKIQLQLAESVDVLDEAGSTVSTVGRLYLAIFVTAWTGFVFLCSSGCGYLPDLILQYSTEGSRRVPCLSLLSHARQLYLRESC